MFHHLQCWSHVLVLWLLSFCKIFKVFGPTLSCLSHHQFFLSPGNPVECHLFLQRRALKLSRQHRLSVWERDKDFTVCWFWSSFYCRWPSAIGTVHSFIPTTRWWLFFRTAVSCLWFVCESQAFFTTLFVQCVVV